MKRVALFVATNLAVLFVINLILTLLGVRAQDVAGILLMSALIGFGGSLISLMMSKSMAKRSVNARVITQAANPTEAWLLETVAAQAAQWKLTTPEVAIYHSPDPNAFATGASRNSSLVAVSTGLLEHMNKDEVEAVLAHEMAHIGNGDMVTLTLIQGVVNTFVVFLSQIIASLVASSQRGNNEEQHSAASQGTYFLVASVMQALFGFLASIIVMWFSRRREYRADEGAARLVGAGKMIAALQRLQGSSGRLPREMSAMGIAGGALQSLFSTHPTLDSRIDRLRRLG